MTELEKFQNEFEAAIAALNSRAEMQDRSSRLIWGGADADHESFLKRSTAEGMPIGSYITLSRKGLGGESLAFAIDELRCSIGALRELLDD